MDNAKVAIFEEFDAIREILSSEVVRRGHILTASTANMNDAREAIGAIEED